MNTNKISVPAAIVAGAIIIAGAIFFTSGRFSPTSPTTGAQAGAPSTGSTGTTPAVAVNIKNVKTSGEPYVGSATAPVTIAYWFDYQCPFCKQDEETVLPQIMQDYVAKGEVKIVFKDFPFLGPDSQTAALAARAVWDVAPNEFYAWHKAMYDAQEGENSGWATKDAILTITKNVLGQDDTDKVSALMTSKASTYEAEIAADRTEGNSMGVNGTPAMIIGTQILVGAEPYSAVKAAIDQTLGSHN